MPNGNSYTYVGACEERDKLRRQVTALIKVLEWYADDENYKLKQRKRGGHILPGRFSKIGYDKGKKAKDVLDKIND